MASEIEERQKLVAVLPQGVQVAFDSVFPKLTGLGVSRANMARASRLSKTGELLRRFLDDGEEVRSVSNGIVNLTWEALLIGWMSYYINSTTLIVTNKRILFVHTNNKGEPHSYVNQVPLDHVKKAKTGWLFGYLRLKFGRGQISFTRIKNKEAKAIRDLLPLNANATAGIEFMCPSCGAASETHGSPCVSCGTDVKSPSKAAMKSLVVPGLGDWYLGHKVPAVLEMTGSAIGWVFLGAAAVGWLTGDVTGFIGFIVWLAIVGVGHGLDAAVTYAQGKKGMYSLDGALPTQARERVPVPVTTGGSTTPTATH